ncbi:ABC transporter permease [Herbiconiux sp. CPCC 205763]|uniref:ABC transporter permease n=1 Tax=Herbiconiux aconitum TaxID=2970913 RepID=A0ABT2GNI1_9MICO|nr:ABC transporter permease [Herbiconiux aconitum]MCS5717728.1 ABC transporter permease [Herbiconiux aconitum]
MTTADSVVSATPARALRTNRHTGRIIARRLIEAPIVLLLISAAVFWLVQVVPGDPARAALGQLATPDQLDQWKIQHGLTGSVPERYVSWLGGFVTGNWGESLTYQQPVLGLVMGRFANSVLLGAYAFLIVAVVGVALGVYQATRRGRRSDRTATVLTVALSAVPEFAVGTVLLLFFAVFAHWFPVHSEVTADSTLGERISVMTLPAITLACASFGYVARMARAGATETLNSQYYRTAVLEGLPRWRILTGYVARNSLIPSVAVLGAQLAYLVGGSVIVETLFSYPGIGYTIVEAVQKKDLLVLEAAIMVTALASILILLLADLAYMALDPRIDLSRPAEVR